ncbi:Ferric enterobactin transport protein [Escherichia coli]|uniref:Ferric enterobactin transport protein n=1 Tax=Escherichia coli TaxID=562 RepID=A0AAX2KEW2_ECOLX|nr:Ferric enterobactin transport protein [Escherichia coli]
MLDLDIKIDRTEAFNLFIKKFQSVSLLEEYLRSSPYVMDQLKEAKIDELDLHRAIVALSEKMKAVDDNASKKKDEPVTVYLLDAKFYPRQPVKRRRPF